MVDVRKFPPVAGCVGDSVDLFDDRSVYKFDSGPRETSDIRFDDDGAGYDAIRQIIAVEVALLVDTVGGLESVELVV